MTILEAQAPQLHAGRMVQAVRRLQGPPVLVPPVYELWHDGLYQRTSGPVPPGTPQSSDETPGLHQNPPLARRAADLTWVSGAIWFCRDGVNSRGESLIEVGWLDVQGQPKHAWLSSSDVLDHERLARALTPRGFRVTKSSVREVSTFLAVMQSMNPPPTDQELPLVITRSGWYENGWLLGNQWIGPERRNVVVDTFEIPATSRALTPSLGGYADEAQAFGAWRAYAHQYMYHPQYGALVRWYMGAAVAASLIPVVAGRSFVVHTYTKSSLGKTALAKLALSTYGDPSEGKLQHGFKHTENSIDSLFEQEISAAPVLMDELQMAGKMNVHAVVYKFVSAVPKARLDNTGKMRTRGDTWQSVLLTTGEQPLVGYDGNDQGGVSNRVLELRLRPGFALGEAHGREVHQWLTTRRIWGLAAPRMLRAVQEHGLDFFMTRHETLRKRLGPVLQDPVLSAHMSLVALGENLLLGVCGDPQRYPSHAISDLVIADAQRVYEEAIASERAETRGGAMERALIALRDDFQGRRESYELVNDDPLNPSSGPCGPGYRRELTGWVLSSRDPMEIVYRESELKRIIKSVSGEVRTVWHQLADENLAPRESRNLKVKRQSTVGGILEGRYYVLYFRALKADLDSDPVPADPVPTPSPTQEMPEDYITEALSEDEYPYSGSYYPEE